MTQYGVKTCKACGHEVLMIQKGSKAYRAGYSAFCLQCGLKLKYKEVKDFGGCDRCGSIYCHGDLCR